jgi:hypothetical protein
VLLCSVLRRPGPDVSRRSIRAVALLPLLLVLGGAVGEAQDRLPPPERYTLRVEYLWWSPTPSGEIQKGLGQNEGTLLDVQQDLAVESGRANVLSGNVRLGRTWKLDLAWTPLDFRGDTPAPRPFSYGTLVARYGDQIITSFKGNLYSSDLEWDFAANDGGYLGLLFGVRYFDVDAIVLDVDTSGRVAETQKLPVPVVGFSGRVYFEEWVSLEGEIAGITLGSRGHLWDWLAALRVHLTDRLAVTGGYHGLSLEGQDERDFLHLKLSTWTFGLEISL